MECFTLTKNKYKSLLPDILKKKICKTKMSQNLEVRFPLYIFFKLTKFIHLKYITVKRTRITYTTNI